MVLDQVIRYRLFTNVSPQKHKLISVHLTTRNVFMVAALEYLLCTAEKHGFDVILPNKYISIFKSLKKPVYIFAL